MTTRLAHATLLALLVAPSALAETDESRTQMEQDVVLRAMVDELDRNMDNLSFENADKPYFIEYALFDGSVGGVAAQLGAVTNRGTNRLRYFRSDVRVGSYELDNSNFRGGGNFGGDGSPIPIEDDYDAIRQSIWWTTDRDYKGVIETLAQKKAFMEQKFFADKPADFTRREATVHYEERSRIEVDDAMLDQFANVAVAVSAVFREFPDVQSSSVTIQASGGNEYLVNTEGTRMRTAEMLYNLSISATVQAEDGMKLSDSINLGAATFAELPPAEELSTRCREMAQVLAEIAAAPVLESYTGPVLVEAEPAAAMFQQQFANRFAGGQRPVGSTSSPDDFENKIGQRILPRSFSVVDDPTRQELQGKKVLGHYRYDDQGVPAQAVELVAKGKLQTLLMSRNPSKKITESNGHGRGIFGPRASIACLIASSEEGVSDEELRTELLGACADEGLEFGIRIASLGDVGAGSRPRFGGAANSYPLKMYKVYPDGREELVRGAEIARIDRKAFKRMLVAGTKLHVMNVANRFDPETVAAPAMLFEELDLAKIDLDFDKPPILQTPLARGLAAREQE
jgi:hypothetical protein